MPVTVNDLFDRLSRITGYRRPARHGPRRQGDVHRIALDATLAARELGWLPAVGLDEGLRDTVEHFRSLLCPPERRAVPGRTV